MEKPKHFKYWTTSEKLNAIIEYEKISNIMSSEHIQTKLINNSFQKHEMRTITKSKVMIINYKQTPQKFNLYAIIPEDSVVGSVNPKPTKIHNNYIKWNLNTISPSNKVDIYFELAGLKEGDFDENDIYIENINPTFVIGADKWEGE